MFANVTTFLLDDYNSGKFEELCIYEAALYILDVLTSIRKYPRRTYSPQKLVGSTTGFHLT